MTLVDTNVAIDVLTADPVWLDWSVEALRSIRGRGSAFVNGVTYAELAARYDAEDALYGDLRDLGIRLERMPQTALFRAGRAHAAYRAAGGPRTSLLADFFIGAHAEAAGLAILTRDPRRYRTYFPDVPLITP
jgi:predicted nucleic acid-binding protein